MRQRKLMLPAFHGERIDRYREIMREATERAVASLPAGEAFALRPHTQAITLEVIMRAVFGVEDREAMARLRAPLKRFVDWAGNPGALVMVALLGFEHPIVRRIMRRRYLGPVDRELYALIAERRAAPDLAERDDVLSMLLLARDEQGEPMTDAELRDELMTLLTAGHETTATSLAWAVERLVRQPGGLERLAGDPAYVDAVVKETLRLRPVIALVLRKLLEPLEVGGHELPAGTTVAPVILLVHRREDVYPEPEAFRPERFLDRAPGTYSWIPFGGGVRRCLGAAFAQVEMQTVLQTLAESVAPGGRRRRRGRPPARHHARSGARRAGARARGSLACPPLVPDLFLQRDLPPGVPPLALDGERTLPDIPEENYWFRRHLVVYEWIARRIGGVSVVDLACGEGYGSDVLARSAYSVVGVDANPDAHEHARLRYRAPNLRFVRNMVEMYSEPCDAVVFLQTIEHVQDPDAVLENVKGMLRAAARRTCRRPTCSPWRPPAPSARATRGTCASTAPRSSARCARRTSARSSSTACSMRGRCASTSSRCASGGIASTPRCG